MSSPGSEAETEWFVPTSGRISGVLGLLAAVVILGLAVLGHAPADYLALGLLVALLSWMVLLRPRVGVRGSDLLLRGIVSTVVIPVAAVESVAVRQVLAVRAADRRYVSAAVGHSYGQIAHQRRRPRDLPPPTSSGPPRYADHVADTIDRRAREARREGQTAGAVRRQWAWPEIAGVVVLALALVVLLLT
ncbi:hypothetical protein [Nocardioides sp.]|uniref:hypothetical protein n=1 Tax=Nocardioides sp. TaxID=35761 RepID=UPI0039E6A10E